MGVCFLFCASRYEGKYTILKASLNVCILHLYSACIKVNPINHKDHQASCPLLNVGVGVNGLFSSNTADVFISNLFPTKKDRKSQAKYDVPRLKNISASPWLIDR